MDKLNIKVSKEFLETPKSKSTFYARSSRNFTPHNQGEGKLVGNLNFHSIW